MARSIEQKAPDAKARKHQRVVIIGYPKCGKTTLAKSMGGGRSTDEVMNLGWSEASEAVSHWFDKPGPWIIEGVAVPRALRKWKERNPNRPAPVDRIILLTKPHQTLSKGQLSMSKGIDKVFAEIKAWLTATITIEEGEIEQEDVESKLPRVKAPVKPKPQPVKKQTESKQAPVSKKPSTKKAEKKPQKKSVKAPNTRKRGPHITKPTLEEEIAIVERQKLVIALYKTFRSVRRVASYLQSKGYEGVSKTTVARDIQSWLQTEREDIKHSVEELRQLEVSTLNDLQSAVLPRAIQHGREADIRSTLAIIRERDRFQNISKAQQADTDSKAMLAKLLGLEPEQMPDDRSE